TGNAESGERIQIAGRQTSQPSVAQPGLLLLGGDLLQIEIQLLHRLLHLLAEPEVQNVVLQMWSHEELGRKVGNHSNILAQVVFGRVQPAPQETIAHGVGDGRIVIERRRRSRKPACDIEEIIEDSPLQGFYMEAGAIILDQDLLLKKI